METDLQEIADFEAFLEERLDPKDREAFEARLAQEPELQEKLDAFRQTQLAVEAMGEENLKAFLKSVDQEMERERGPAIAEPKPQPSKWSWLIPAAAAVFILVVIGWAFFSTTEGEKLYASHFDVYPDRITQRDQADNPFALLMHKYNEGEYAEFLAIYAEDSPPELSLYAGVAALVESREDEAITLLEPLVKAGEGRFYAPALWYTGLAHLKEGRTDQAKKIFGSLVDLGAAYSSEAKKVLAEMP